MTTSNNQETATRGRRPWEPPTLKTVGTIGEVLRQGGGKVSILTGDPGEPRKVGPTG